MNHCDQGSRDTMVTYQLLLAVCILFAVAELGSCNCPVYGCTLFHSFTTPTQYFNSSAKPRLLWEFVHDQLRPTGAGCVTNGGRVLCPMVVNGQERYIGLRLSQLFHLILNLLACKNFYSIAMPQLI